MNLRWTLVPGLDIEARPVGDGRFVAAVVQDRGDGPADVWYLGATVIAHTPEGQRVSAPSWPLDDIGTAVEDWIDSMVATARADGN